MEEEIIIRPYAACDRGFVRDIAYDTALLGDSAIAFFEDREILSDFLTVCYLDYEPESCLVAESDNKVIGYLIGTKYVTVLEKVFRARILPSLLTKLLISGALFKKENITLIFHLALSFLKGEFKMPDCIKACSAVRPGVWGRSREIICSGVA